MDSRGDEDLARYLGEPADTGTPGRLRLGRMIMWSLVSVVAALALMAVWIAAGLIVAIASPFIPTR